MNPLISIIIPVYKVEEYIDECVESIVNQSYKNLEIILVDDGSPDNCPAICDEWAKKDQRIKVIHQKNAGQSAARNAALKIATGEFIGFVDSDDFIDRDMYKILYEALSGSTAKISSCYFLRTDGSKSDETLKVSPLKTYSVNEALREFFLKREIGSAVWDKLYRREVFDNIRFPEGETNEEYPMFIPLIVRSSGVVHTGKTLYKYRMRGGSTTDSTWKTDADIILKHLYEMKDQIAEDKLKAVEKEFNVFCADSAFSVALQLDKNYSKISSTAKENQKKYLKLMRKNLFAYLCSSSVLLKDKILYLMVATRTLRPIYKILGKK